MFEHVHISNGVTKLGASIPSVNLPAVKTCREDAPCFKTCYARRGRFAFSHNKELLDRNLRIWYEDPESFERDVTIAAFHARYFRWHSSGDIVDMDYLKMMIRVARALPHTSFLCFTKKYELVNEYLSGEWHQKVVCHESFPPNLKIVLSAWGDWMPENPYNLPVAYIAFKKGENACIPEDAKPCPKFCGDCVMTGCSCWDLNTGESVVFNEH